MPTEIPPAVVETIFRLLWKNLPHESWSAKEEVEAWWNLAFVDKAALKLMKGWVFLALSSGTETLASP